MLCVCVCVCCISSVQSYSTSSVYRPKSLRRSPDGKPSLPRNNVSVVYSCTIMCWRSCLALNFEGIKFHGIHLCTHIMGKLHVQICIDSEKINYELVHDIWVPIAIHVYIYLGWLKMLVLWFWINDWSLLHFLQDRRPHPPTQWISFDNSRTTAMLHNLLSSKKNRTCSTA